MNDVGGIVERFFGVGCGAYETGQGDVAHFGGMAVIFVDVSGHFMGANQEGGGDALFGYYGR